MYDPELLKNIIVQAGKISLDHFMQVTPRWKQDRSYVTEADLKVQEFLRHTLEQHFPDDGFVAEENDLRKAPRAGTRFWVVDPIDGTASFAAGLPIWGVGIGLVENGHPLAGFFYAPIPDDLFYTTPSGQVYRNDQPVRMRPPHPFHQETSIFVTSRLHRDYVISRTFPGKLRNLGSSIAHLCYVAAGNADAALVGRVYIWDIAAGMAALRLNGGVLHYLTGAPVDLTELLDGHQAAHSMLGGPPETVTALIQLIKCQDDSNRSC